MSNIVHIKPKSVRARNRVREHGHKMKLLKKGTFQGEPAVLVQSLEKTWGRGEKWLGWLTQTEADVTLDEDEEPSC